MQRIIIKVEMNALSVANRVIGAQVRTFPRDMPCAKLSSLCFQIARKVGEVPSPSHLQGLENVEEMVALPKQSEGAEVEEAERKSRLTQLQMIIEMDTISKCFSYL
jgi:hypothetical protein